MGREEMSNIKVYEQSSLLTDLLTAIRGDDLEMPEAIQPIGWLHSLVEECKSRGPAPDDGDPDAWWTMLSEVDTLVARLRLILSQRSPSRQSHRQDMTGGCKYCGNETEWIDGDEEGGYHADLCPYCEDIAIARSQKRAEWREYHPGEPCPEIELPQFPITREER